MAINVSFGGATIYRPGAYSKTSIDLGGGFPLSATGIVAIMGESDAGAPGAQETDISLNVFSPDQFPQIKAKYGSGNIVDAANFLFAPASDGAVPAGASAIYIYKTNASVRAMMDPLEAGTTDFGRLRSREWGVGGNSINFKNELIADTAPEYTSGVITFPLNITLATNDEIKYSINGAPAATATIAAGAYANLAALLPALNTAFGGAIIASAGAAADTVKFTLADSSSAHRDGRGRTMQFDTANANASLAITAHSFAVAASEYQCSALIRNASTSLEESGLIGGQIVLSIGRSNAGSCTAAAVTINATDIILSQTGATPASYTLPKANFTSIAALAEYINTLSGWNAVLASTLLGTKPVSILDRVSAAGAFYSGSTEQAPARIKQDAALVEEFFAQSSLVKLIPLSSSSDIKRVGLFDEQGYPSPIYLTGGALGATSSAEIVTALSKLEKVRVNAIIPLFSRDASDDIADGLSDVGSTYTIDGIMQAVKTHLSLMATIKKRSERQGYLSFKGTYATCKDKAADMASSRIQLVIQDIRQADSDGVIKWFQPWAGACMLAGARCGASIGLPMTFKFFNMTGIRHTDQAMSTPEADIVLDFDPDTQYDDAILNGITFWERPQTGGFRLVVDNTTYGKDANWVYNRGHVMYAADVIAFDFRNQLENIYVGLKNTVTESEIRSTCESVLSTYLAQGITVSTADAKSGFKQLTVQINGNTVNISVVVKLVEGIDFVLSDTFLQRATA